MGKQETNVLGKLNEIQTGYSKGVFKNRKYGITKTVFNDGRSIKLYAKELGGNDFISLNFYITSLKKILKPCEMPKQKVIEFVMGVALQDNKGSM